MPNINSCDKSSTLTTAVMLAALVIPTLGCSETPAPAPVKPQISESEARSLRLDQVESFDNGVYVFPADQYFPQTLSDFRKEHSDERVISVANGKDQLRSNRMGHTHSYYAQSETFIVVTEPIQEQK